MQNSISTEVVKLDLGVILAHYKEPKFWQKKWPILDTKELKVVWYITSIDTVNDKINSQVAVIDKNIKRGNKDLSNVWWKEYETLSPIPINNKEYTQQHFENALYGRTIALLHDVERHIIYEYAEYKHAEKLQDEFKDKLRDIANEFLDSFNVKDEDIRNAYINAYVDKQYEKDATISNLTIKVLENYEHKIILDSYIYAAAWFNRENAYINYKEMDPNKKSIGFDLWNKCKEIQSEKWQNSMKEQLNKII